jgi:hypothetical protein
MSTPRTTVQIHLAGKQITLTPAQVELLRFIAGHNPTPPRRVQLRSYQALTAQHLITASTETSPCRITRRGKQVTAVFEGRETRPTDQPQRWG